MDENQEDQLHLDKKYYTIGEVSKMFGLSVEVLRKWERDFPSKIKPMRTKGETRLYRQSDIEKIQMIYRMRHNEGKTIGGVRRTLHNNPGVEETKQEIISHLQTIRRQLQSVVDGFDVILSKSGQSRM